MVDHFDCMCELSMCKSYVDFIFLLKIRFDSALVTSCPQSVDIQIPSEFFYFGKQKLLQSKKSFNFRGNPQQFVKSSLFINLHYLVITTTIISPKFTLNLHQFYDFILFILIYIFDFFFHFIQQLEQIGSSSSSVRTLAPNSETNSK